MDCSTQEMERSKDFKECALELSFEYLIASNELRWITIASDQAIFMSVCLQAMIDELLQKCVVDSMIQVCCDDRFPRLGTINALRTMVRSGSFLFLLCFLPSRLRAAACRRDRENRGRTS